MREEWLQERTKGIGGSDAPAVCGVSPWRTPYQVWLSKRGESEPQEDNEPMYWGRALEPAIRQRYADETGRSVVVPKEILRHPNFEWMIANIDGEVPAAFDGPRILEIKTSRTGEGWGEPGSSDIPAPYLVQVQHYMMVRGYPVADVATLIAGNDFRVYEVPADPVLQKLIFEREANFWKMVLDGTPPEPTTYNDIKKHFGKTSKAVVVQADAAIIAAVERIKQIKEILAEEENLKAMVMGFMKEADTLAYGDKILATWKASKPAKRFDLKDFQGKHSELYNMFLKEGDPSRRFLIK